MGVLVAAFSVFEAFVEVEAGHFGAFEALIIVEGGLVVSVSGGGGSVERRESFEELAVPGKNTAQSFHANIVPCCGPFFVVMVYVIPHWHEFFVEWVFLEWFAFLFRDIDNRRMH
jgi:hypothetical protein